ncbi:hypothetical protein CEXT_347681 [Caerostris extrusa]|uniref:Uncharacterized protein n=1 Tax=Caerostris extrusa TaxID=172846 RepID=A0AAV4SFJ6_CAEEX|nr:hypothetical protein CEXT_347681 [Caerostris extrusa]
MDTNPFLPASMYSDGKDQLLDDDQQRKGGARLENVITRRFFPSTKRTWCLVIDIHNSIPRNGTLELIGRRRMVGSCDAGAF